MNKRSIMMAALAGFTALSMAGCGYNVSVNRAPLGPTKTQEIDVPMPDAKDQVWDVQLDPAVGEVAVTSSGESLVQGTIAYNTDMLKPEVAVGENSVRIRQSVPTDVSFGPGVKNEWDIQLGPGQPMNLRIHTGATRGTYELGGLSLRTAEFALGATDTSISFRKPNPETVTDFTLTGGAATVIVTGLGNLNIRRGSITAGAGAFRLSFGGELRQDAEISLEGGVSTFDIDSAGNPVQVIADKQGLSTIHSSAGWTQNGNTYSSPEMAGASGPKIVIRVNVGLGTVNLLSSR